MRRGLVAATVIVVLVYVAICGWMYVYQRGLIYFPQATRAPVADTDFALRRDDGIVLRGWVVNPGKPRAILYFGGNAENVAHMRVDAAHWFPGETTYLLAYRGYGASDGTPDEAHLFADALAFHDAVTARHPGQPVSVIGRSLGSGVGTYLAARRPIARLALVTPFDALSEVGQHHYPWLPVRWLARDRFRSVDYLPQYRGPLLVLRAGRDEVIPAASTDALLKAARRAPQVIAFPNADHNSISDDPRYGEALKTFMR